MQKFQILVFTAGLLALAACSSTPTNVDKGAIRAATFNFVNNGAPPQASIAENRKEVHTIIQEAISANLGAKGLRRAQGVGDVTVAYLVIVGNNATTASIDDYFGYGRDAAALADKAQDAYNKSKNPNYFEAGTLVIDIIDSKSFALLQRHHVTRPLLQNATPEARRARLQEAVDEALRNLRVTR